MSDETLKGLEEHVPADMQARFREVVEHTDAFCDAHLNAEYKELCREMAAVLFQAGSPALKGKTEGWAAGVVYSIGWVNFLTDPSQTPHMRSEDIAKRMRVSQATMLAKSKVIREGMELLAFDPEWTLPSLLGQNPLVWMVEAPNGMIFDIRGAPRNVQEEAFRRGIIPFVPVDMDEDKENPNDVSGDDRAGSNRSTR